MSDQGALFTDPPAEVRAKRTYALAPELGRKLRDEAIVQVETHADPDWKDIAYTAAREIARGRLEFTADDVWERIADRASTHEPRALGAVMQRLARAHVITNTNRVVQSRLPQRHARPVAIWRSNVCEQVGEP